jgi:hypothetical protein
MTPAATQRRPDRDRFAAGGTNHMTDFDYGLAGRRTAWPVASPAEMFWPDILSPVSHLEGDREFADSPLEGGVYCELVSEVGLRRLANKARFQGVYG